ncbi:hypothetical protein [Ileibacterium valens]|uniref:hypothetical protein n=1 Tax=Ileibacterium valens TaxID=1862668 RepID=UPI002731E999|nr:hypothetical protein [Ileibacterium valens]
MSEFRAEWTGGYPCLCWGEWKLYKDNKDISHLIPEELRYCPMNTYGIYEIWCFTEEGLEEFDSYEDGLDESDWIEANKDWLLKISTDENDLDAIFEAFQISDFRRGSCGAVYEN